MPAPASSTENIKITSANRQRVKDLWVKPNDIFIQRSNTPELVGTTRRYTGESNVAIFPDLLIRLRVSSLLLTSFVERSLQSPRCHLYFRSKAQGISGSMPKIDQQVIERCAIAVPPLKEQEAIVDIIEEQFSMIDRLENDITTRLHNSTGLRQSILSHAFTGQLAPQVPTDEPASTVLTRIAAEREQCEQQARAVKKTKSLAQRKRVTKSKK